MSKLQELIQELCPNGVEYKKLGEVCELSRGKVYSKTYIIENSGDYPVYSSQTANDGALGKISTYDYDGEYLTWTTDGAYAGTIFHRKGKFSITNVCGLITIKSPDLLIRFLYYWLSIKAKEHVYSGMGNPKLMSNQMAPIEIPIPPLEVQEEIVKILDRFAEYAAELQAELQARQEQYEFYRDKLLSFNNINGVGDASVTWMKMSEIGDICMCKRIMKEQTNNISGVPFYKIGTFGKVADAYISRELYEDYKERFSFPVKGEILISASGTIGRTVVYDGKDAYFQDSNIVWIHNDETKVLNKYLYHYYKLIEWNVEGGTIKRLYNNNLAKTQIAVPSLSEQERIVTILDKFETLVSDLSQGLPAEIAAIQEQYEYYRNRLLSFPRNKISA